MDGIEIVCLYKKDPSIFDRWDEEGYAGCSQEGMNSHYYAPRFAKLASRFKPSFCEQGKQGDPAEEYSVIHSFPLFWKRYIFVQEGRARKKEEKDYVTVRVAVAK